MDKKYFLKFICISAATALLVSFLVGAGFIWWAGEYSHYGNEGKDSSDLYSFETVVVEAVEKANPAVVAITISKNIPVYERYFEEVPGPFGGLFNFVIPQYWQRGVKKEEVGGGSGFIVSPDGYILTNRHVVEDEDAKYTVFMNDGTNYDAQVIRRDTELDIAVIKIKGSEFPYLPFGNSDDLKVGQSVIAIGNALAEFRNTVSFGIVSGLARSIVASDRQGNRESLDQLIQTDAAINQGNSGGPLLNLRGEVIGINVAVATEAENIGFAISGNSAKKIFESVQNPKE